MKEQSNNKIVILESITAILVPIVFLYLMRGYKISYFKVDSKVERKKWFQKKLQQKLLEEIKWESYDFEFHLLSHEKAFEQIEKIYSKRFENSKMIKKVETFLKTDVAHLIYKKVLIEKLQDVFHIKLLLDNFVDNSDYKTYIFFPSGFFEIKSIMEYKLHPQIKVSLSSYFIFCLINIINKLKYLITIVLLPIWIIIHIKKIVPNEKYPKRYQTGIRIYRTDLGFYSRLRRIDFLLDDKKINKNNTLFCIETKISDKYMERLKEKKYNITEIPRILSEVDKNFMKETLNMGYLYICFKVAVLSCLEPSFLARPSITILHQYLVWKRFLVKYYIKNYVVYNDFGASHITRNIIFNQNEIQTWYYEHSCHYGDTFIPPGSNLTYRHPIFSYLYYDNLVSWGNKPMQYFRNHPTLIRQYINLGTLWSEHVRMVSEGKVKSNLPNGMKSRMNKLPAKVISVFDTTFGQDVPLQSNDMFLFIEGILKLLDDHPEIGVIFKEKWPWEEMLELNPTTEIKTIYEKLKSHERCYTAGNTSESAEAIAASDLVISACFTSSTIEALGARKKAVYFDASDKLRDYYYDKFPKLVAHGYNELKKLVRYWLYDITDEEFEKYLETYVKGELDAYVDGRAITRFRELLTQEVETTDA